MCGPARTRKDASILTASRALALSSQSSPELPRIDALQALYNKGVKPRQGELMMIAGRSGTQKSGFALWLVLNWGLPVLYFSADMSPFQASVRIACSVTGETTPVVEAYMADDKYRQSILDATRDVPMTFSFGSPITWRGIDAEIAAWVELHNSFPPVIVVDNLMDIDGAAADYQSQMDAMQNLSDISRATGATLLVLHHASDKSWDARSDPWSPPSRDQVKGGLSEKPELSLSVGLDPYSMEYKIACIKQRMGPSDPTAKNYATILCEPDKTRFHAFPTGAPAPVEIGVLQ